VAKILVIEDEPSIQRLIGYALQTKGYEVLVAGDGQQGLDTVRSEFPDLILLDMVMPHMGGMEVLKVVKGDPRLKHIPVLVVTASAQKGDAEKAIRMGAAGYLIKPFHVPMLYERVEELLSGKADEGQRS
jgi:two-component system alkaline phosphatase synthesis response regulator PhoP